MSDATHYILPCRWAATFDGRYQRWPAGVPVPAGAASQEHFGNVVGARPASEDDIEASTYVSPPVDAVEIDNMTVPQAREWIEAMNVTAYLWDVEAHELTHRGRRGVLRAIANRIIELKESEG